MSVTETTPPKSTYEPICWNFKLLAQHELDGFGGMGEGMSVQIAPDGRRIIWLAHESAPKNFTAVDVSDPRKPRVVVQTDLPQSFMRSNSLEITGNTMAVAYQTRRSDRSRPGLNCSTFRFRKSRSRFPTWTARANSHAASTSSGSATANTSTWPRARPTSNRRIRSMIKSIAASTSATLRNPPRSAAGGFPARATATMSPRRRAIRDPRSIKATAPTTRTSIRNDRTGCTSPTSTPACSSWTFPTSRNRNRSAASTIRRPIQASRIRCCRCSNAISW